MLSKNKPGKVGLGSSEEVSVSLPPEQSGRSPLSSAPPTSAVLTLAPEADPAELALQFIVFG